jgi:hypothetical protein
LSALSSVLQTSQKKLDCEQKWGKSKPGACYELIGYESRKRQAGESCKMQSLDRRGQFLVVFGEPPTSGHPCEGTFGYAIHHSDRGSQYCCEAYIRQLQAAGMGKSMTEQTHCCENGHAERLNGVLKQELGLGENIPRQAMGILHSSKYEVINWLRLMTN